MAKILNISDKLSLDRPVIEIGEKSYPVDDSTETVLKFEELAAEGSVKAIISGIELAIGEEAAKELNVTKFSVPNLKVIFMAVIAAIQGISYEEAEARFQQHV